MKSAVQNGLNMLINEHPRFAQFQDYLLRHIDQKKMREKIDEVRKRLKDERLSDDETAYQVQKDISDYVASGAVLDDKGQEVLLGKGLEEKVGFWKKLFHKPEFNGERYLDRTFSAFQDLYDLMKSGDYAKRMPELSESVSSLYNLQFLDPAIGVLKSHGLINTEKYRFLKDNVYKRAQEESSKIVGGIEKYVVPERIAASFLAVIGIVIFVSGLKINGAVIGSLTSQANFPFGVLGFFVLLFSAILFILSSRKKLNI